MSSTPTLLPPNTSPSEELVNFYGNLAVNSVNRAKFDLGIATAGALATGIFTFLSAKLPEYSPIGITAAIISGLVAVGGLVLVNHNATRISEHNHDLEQEQEVILRTNQ